MNLSFWVDDCESGLADGYSDDIWELWLRRLLRRKSKPLSFWPHDYNIITVQISEKTQYQINKPTI